MNPLPSKKQHALLEFIDGFIKEHNYAPSYRETARALGYKSVSTVAKHVDGLIERGWLVKRDNAARSVEVVYKAGKSESGSPAPAPPRPARADEPELLRRLDEARAAVEIGASYAHYKGGAYMVVDVAIQTTDDEPCVLYRVQYGEGVLFTRPLSEWLETVDANGVSVSRFSKTQDLPR